MKIKYIVIFLCLFSIKNLLAQKDSTKLFHTQKFESSFFVEVGTDFVQVNKSGGLNFNLSLNWMADKRFVVGAAYSQLASVEHFQYSALIPGPILTPETYGKIKHQSFGLRLGYIFLEEHKIISLSPEIIAGWGNTTLDIQGTSFNEKIHFGKIEPNIKAIFNISHYLKIALNIHYRVHIGKGYSSDNLLHQFSFSPSDLNGVGGGLSLRFGKF